MPPSEVLRQEINERLAIRAKTEVGEAVGPGLSFFVLHLFFFFFFFFLLVFFLLVFFFFFFFLLLFFFFFFFFFWLGFFFFFFFFFFFLSKYSKYVNIDLKIDNLSTVKINLKFPVCDIYKNNLL